GPEVGRERRLSSEHCPLQLRCVRAESTVEPSPVSLIALIGSQYYGLITEQRRLSCRHAVPLLALTQSSVGRDTHSGHNQGSGPIRFKETILDKLKFKAAKHHKISYTKKVNYGDDISNLTFSQKFQLEPTECSIQEERWPGTAGNKVLVSVMSDKAAGNLDP
ncbi:hypothetical protein J6590_102138, partial [Homalodisca vitripennis]